MKVTEHFTSHPASVGETYGEHLAFASGAGGRMMLGGLACVLHGLFPFAFTTTGSRTIAMLTARFEAGQRAAVMARVKAELVEDAA